ncbi:MAG: SurA N-terminal domain-containing protein, partial [Thermoleophilia bacterium]
MMKKMIIALLAVVVAIAAALLVTGCGSLPKSAVAEVNGKVITKEDLDNKIQDLQAQYGSQGGLPQPGTPEYADFQKQVAEELVTEEVMWFEADKMGIRVTDDDVNKQIDQIKQSVGGDKQFQQALSQRNMTLDRLKDNVRKGLIYQKLFDQVTKNQGQVSDQQAQDYYNQHKSDGTFQQPEQRQVRHILVADQATAQKIEAQ